MGDIPYGTKVPVLTIRDHSRRAGPYIRRMDERPDPVPSELQGESSKFCSRTQVEVDVIFARLRAAAPSRVRQLIGSPRPDQKRSPHAMGAGAG